MTYSVVSSAELTSSAVSNNSALVFCDWLDVTYWPDLQFVDRLRSWLDAQLCSVRYADKTRVLLDVGQGVLALDVKPRFVRVSASGAVLSHFRSIGKFEEYLSLLSEAPHKVTRLDAACDYDVDGPEFLRFLESRFPTDRVNLQRKALVVTRLYSSRESDGRLTGTWYAGHRSNARVTARVYDKQAEALAKRNESLPPRTRVELTFRRDHGCTLRDAAMPYSLYHQFASPLLPDPVHGAPEWVPHGSGWSGEPAVVPLPYQILKRRLETSPELSRLVELADSLGPEGRALLLRLVERRFTYPDTAVPDLGAVVGSDGAD